MPMAILSNAAIVAQQILVAGQRCPILGRVTMDYLIIDVTDVPHQPVPGDQVVLLGAQGDEP